MNTANNKEDDNVSVCANCGKEGAKNICNKCKQVKYCNAVCKKVHKKKHKRDCEEYVRLAAELHDEKLFKQPPPKEEDDCPICFLRMPTHELGYRYKSCCGKVICSGCEYAPVYDDKGNEVPDDKCPFCRTPYPCSEKEVIIRMKKRVEANDPNAIYNLGCDFRDGTCGYSQDYTKALELFHRASEIGCAGAHCNIGDVYENGDGVEVDTKKAIHHYELAAIMGDEKARYNLGFMEEKAGNMDRALKHYTIAARNGLSDSLEAIQLMYKDGRATKEDYTKALQAYQEYLGEIKSAQRDEAAAAHEEYRYY